MKKVLRDFDVFQTMKVELSCRSVASLGFSQLTASICFSLSRQCVRYCELFFGERKRFLQFFSACRRMIFAFACVCKPNNTAEFLTLSPTNILQTYEPASLSTPQYLHPDGVWSSHHSELTLPDQTPCVTRESAALILQNSHALDESPSENVTESTQLIRPTSSANDNSDCENVKSSCRENESEDLLPNDTLTLKLETHNVIVRFMANGYSTNV